MRLLLRPANRTVQASIVDQTILAFSAAAQEFVAACGDTGQGCTQQKKHKAALLNAQLHYFRDVKWVWIYGDKLFVLHVILAMYAFFYT